MSERIVTKLEYPDKRKIKIFLDGELFGNLYKGEIRRFGITEGQALTEDIVSEIDDVLYKRAKERALYIIQKMEKTRHEIYDKLKTNNYRDETICRVIEFLEKYGFVDDYMYAVHYIDYKGKSKSRRMINNNLRLKGIDKDTILAAWGESDDNELDIIQRIIMKKAKNYKNIENDEKRKIINHLLYKGFSYEDIKIAFENIDEIIDET